MYIYIYTVVNKLRESSDKVAAKGKHFYAKVLTFGHSHRSVVLNNHHIYMTHIRIETGTATMLDHTRPEQEQYRPENPQLQDKFGVDMALGFKVSCLRADVRSLQIV